jgi:MFS superfamily sulfate permease-like transporter
VLVYRFGSSLYFANANIFAEEIEKLLGESPMPVRSFVLDAEAILDLDVTGADAFREVLGLMSEHDVTFALSRANKPLIKLLANYDLLDKIGEDRLYPTNRHALAVLRDEQSSEQGDTAPGAEDE